MKRFNTIIFALIFTFLFSHTILAANPKAIIVTSMGDIEIELFEDKAPISVKNFITYANEGFYTGTIFHRVIKRFMIQTGGLDKDMNKKKTHAPIRNEANNKVPNLKGTLAMARTGAPHSATAQFFINTKNNFSLNYAGEDRWGYAVFGKVTKGMDVVMKIESVRTGRHNGRGDVPKKTIEIKSVKILN